MNGGKVCTFENCNKPHEARGLCRGHYTQYKRGRALTDIRIKRPVSDAHFWRNVDKKSEAECWEWIGFVHPTGYGRCGNGRFGTRSAHKYSYILAYGMVPSGMVVDHVCRNKRCVNPGHLRAITTKQNTENVGGLYVNNTSGATGVRKFPNGTFQARVRHNGKLHYFGTYKSFEEAEAAAVRGRNQLFTHNDQDRERVYFAALVAIQEEHKARFIGTQEDGTPIYACMVCLVDDNGTCKTRRLADDALGGDQDG